MFLYNIIVVIKGNVAAYKDLNLVTVTIKRYFSREHSERMERSTGVDPFVCGGTRGTYVRVLVQRSSGFREYRLAREEERRQTGPRAGRIVTQRLPTRVDYVW